MSKFLSEPIFHAVCNYSATYRFIRSVITSDNIKVLEYIKKHIEPKHLRIAVKSHHDRSSLSLVLRYLKSSGQYIPASDIGEHMMTLVNNNNIVGLHILLSSVNITDCTRGTIIAVICQALRKEADESYFRLIGIILAQLTIAVHSLSSVEVIMSDVALLSHANSRTIQKIIDTTAQLFYEFDRLSVESFMNDFMARRLFMMPLSTIKYWVKMRGLLKNVSIARRQEMMTAAINDVSYMIDIEKRRYLQHLVSLGP